MSSCPLYLSICIPTKNRADELVELLESIAIQNPEKVEVVISDNSDDDATRNAVSRIAGRISIVYFKQPTPVPFGENLFSAVSRASGEYLWLMGDDDLLCPGSIQTILDTTQANKPDSVLVNISSWNSDFSRCFSELLFDSSVRGTPAPLEQQLDVHLGVLSFIGCHVIKSSQRFQESLHKWAISTYPHVMAYAEVYPTRIVLIGEVLIKQRLQPVLRWNIVHLYTVDYPKVFQTFKDASVSARTLYRWKRKLVRSEMARVLAGARIRESKPFNLIPLIRNYGTTPEFWIFVFPMQVIPKKILALMKSAFGYYK